MRDLRVLIVEDDQRVADLHRRFTERVPGFAVVGMADDYGEAREQALILEPDLVLLDLYLPQGTGLELLKELRREGLQLDVILMTAARDPETLQRVLRGGVFDYIIKPVVFKRFEESLGKYRAFRGRVAESDQLEQAEVDRLLHPSTVDEGGTAGASDLPKGIDPLTLEKVRTACPAKGEEGVSAEAMGVRLGVSRTTARRYLEHLVSAGFLSADVSYGTVGRPERLYRRG